MNGPDRSDASKTDGVRIAVLDDDVECADHVSRLMASAEHTATSFYRASELLEALRHERFELLLLDWSLPEISGIDVLQWAKENLDPAPSVIMVTASAEPGAIAAGLRAGADDYVTKPIHDGVLSARVAAVLRRAYAETKPKAALERYGRHVFNVQERTVTIDDAPVTTTDKEFILALMMFRNLDKPLSRDHLMQSIWGSGPEIMSRTLDAHISLIRRRLSLRPDHGVRLSAVYGFGYRLERVVDPS